MARTASQRPGSERDLLHGFLDIVMPFLLGFEPALLAGPRGTIQNVRRVRAAAQ